MATRPTLQQHLILEEMTPSLAISGASLVLAADDSPKLAAFYGCLLACRPVPGFNSSHWRLPLPGGAELEIYSPSRARPLPRQTGRLSLCLQQDGTGQSPHAQLQRWIALAISAGAILEAPPRLEPFGAEAWLLDPEGNRLLLLVR
jgi:hypothetical protein